MTPAIETLQLQESAASHFRDKEDEMRRRIVAQLDLARTETAYELIHRLPPRELAKFRHTILTALQTRISDLARVDPDGFAGDIVGLVRDLARRLSHSERERFSSSLIEALGMPGMALAGGHLRAFPYSGSPSGSLDGAQCIAQEDVALAEEAKQLIRERYERKVCHIAAVVRGASGRTYPGLHLGTRIPGRMICAEVGALHTARVANECKLDVVVAAKWLESSKTAIIVPPCGSCREVLLDYGVRYVIIGQGGVLRKVPLPELLPYPYRCPECSPTT